MQEASESATSSEWVKAYELERKGWKVLIYRATALTWQRHTFSSAEAHSELHLDGATLNVTQHWLPFVCSSVGIQ